MTHTTTLEKNKKFSDSLLWEYQQYYFDKEGVQAWASQVPFYITSNPFIANCYAQVAIGFIHDLLRQNKCDLNEPVYIIELGTGSGRFSYYCMKRIFELQKELGLDAVKIKYVLTDFTENNLKFWDEHPALKPYVDRDQCDFAIFNLENDKSITLTKSKVTLEKGSAKNPIIAMGNYIFDTISHDAFRVEKGQLAELRTRLETFQDNMKNNKPKKLEKITTTFQPKFIEPSQAYENNILNDILADYQEKLTSSSLLIPIGGIKTMDTLADLSNQRLLIISTDKGYSEYEELDRRPDPRVVFHGSFSMMVNFHALGEYCRRKGGDVFHQMIRKAIKTSLFVQGFKLDELTLTKHAAHQYIESFGPGDFFNMHEHLKKTNQNCDLKNVISHLRLSQWDPHIFRIFAERIAKEVQSADSTIVNSLKKGIPQILANIYLMPKAHNTYFDIAIFYHAIKDYSNAVLYYDKSNEHHGEHYTTVFNMGLCHYSLNDLHKALETFKKAKTLNPDNRSTDDWIKRVEDEISTKE
ncbi:MAG: tetratricopeptide repeat protein [Gammaproteobacteria bacterium]